jgi:hypothetical protein
MWSPTPPRDIARWPICAAALGFINQMFVELVRVSSSVFLLFLVGWIIA